MKFQQMADCEVGGVCRDTVSHINIYKHQKLKIF